MWTQWSGITQLSGNQAPDAAPDAGAGGDQWFTLFWAPILVGVLLWLVAETVRWVIGRRNARRARRLQIVGALYQAESMIFRAVRDGDFEKAWVQDSREPLRAMRERYDDLTVETFSLFVRGEEDAAFWAAAEFYSGFADPIHHLSEHNVPRVANPEGWPLISMDAMGAPAPYGWQPPRGEMLLDWAAGAKGPRYGDLFYSGDHARHHLVKPNSDVNGAMLRPPIWILEKRRRDLTAPSRWQRWLRRSREPAPSTTEEIAACATCSRHLPMLIELRGA